MNVGELIEELKKYNKHTPVMIDHTYGDIYDKNIIRLETIASGEPDGVVSLVTDISKIY